MLLLDRKAAPFSQLRTMSTHRLEALRLVMLCVCVKESIADSCRKLTDDFHIGVLQVILSKISNIFSVSDLPLRAIHTYRYASEPWTHRRSK